MSSEKHADLEVGETKSSSPGEKPTESAVTTPPNEPTQPAKPSFPEGGKWGWLTLFGAYVRYQHSLRDSHLDALPQDHDAGFHIRVCRIILYRVKCNDWVLFVDIRTRSACIKGAFHRP